MENIYLEAYDISDAVGDSVKLYLKQINSIPSKQMNSFSNIGINKLIINDKAIIVLP